ncbi:MAG: peptidylprolyl isomerase [Pseudomonadota bacterium]|nr:peptidylprolyl isomerase [Pseudomonadota bacterium]
MSLFLTAVVPTNAQETMKIAAVVNSEIITMRDIETRMRIVLLASNLRPTRAVIERLGNQVLQTLIDERLKLEAAKKRQIEVTKTEFSEAVAILGKRNKIDPERFRQYLTSKGIDWNAMSNQIRAQILWSKLVQRILLPKIIVSDDEVNDRLKQLSSNLNKREYDVSEILLSPDKSGGMALAQENAEQLIEYIENGADFGVLAGDFSDSTSASSRGNLGWQQLEDLPPFVRPYLLKMGPGDISPPIAFKDGIYIIRVNKVRSFENKNGEMEEVNLRRMLLGATPNDPVGDRGGFAKRIEKIREKILSCNDFDQVAKTAGYSPDTKLGRLKLKELSPKIVKKIRNLPIGRPSLPIRIGNNVAIFAVCQRWIPSRIPDRLQIHQNIFKEKLDVLARRFLRDMRVNAIIDIRI